jgi:hypothetical protein
MQRTLLVLLGILFCGASSAMAQGLPDGTYTSTATGCTKLKDKTAAELGQGLDFSILNKTGLNTYQQKCNFLSVTPRNATSWVATAFCEEPNLIYPDMFAIVQKDDGDLKVTRLTDVTQQQDTEAPPPEDDSQGLSDDMNPSELNRDEGDSAAENDQNSDQSNAATEDNTDNDDFGTYVRCQQVKQ